MTATTVLAALSGAAVTAGLLLLVRTVSAPAKPGHPAPGHPLSGPSGRRSRWWSTTAARIWQGPGRGTAEQRRYRVAVTASTVTGAATWLLTGLPVLALVAVAAVPGVPWLLAAGAAERRAIARVEAVSEWTRRLRDVSDTGAGLQAAIVSSAATAPAVISDQVGMLAARLQAGWQARPALLRFADEIRDPVCDQIVAALLLHLKDRGDKLGAVLSSIAVAAAKDVSMRKEADAERASARFAIRFMTGLSLVAVVVAASSRDYLQPYATPFGQSLMVTLAGLFVAVLWWARKLSRPAAAPRLLTSASTRSGGHEPSGAPAHPGTVP
jgi:Flp pilus assembly protein TadB